MAGTTRVGSCQAVHTYVGTICFKTGPPQTVGAELEWLVASATDARATVPIHLLKALLDEAGPPPGGSAITFEPGGQLELSSPPASGVAACWQDLLCDLHHVERVLAGAGVVLLPTAIDPYRPPRRQLTHPRYKAMETYFDRRGPDGRIMMCSTAAVQVNLDAGSDPVDVARRWHILNAVGPTLVAAFANSPLHAGRRTGWKSTRQAVWQRIDPRRTRRPAGSEPMTAWAEYALDAPVMVRRSASQRWLADPGMTFREWLDGDGRPTLDDLAYHLSTLFPPVRPRGWFEVRYVDAQSTTNWPVPVAVLTALVDDVQAGDRALAATESVADAWLDAARHGLDHPGLARAAVHCFDAALDALRRQRVDPALLDLVAAFLHRYVERRRCPADDELSPNVLLSAKGVSR
ncbi:ergothioneine biosynthesis glutamate--cysteine ligase EgtA [Actinopolymorpha alba]|uniref:ergothioneine biosynthesis glutamate--cysteine ligase EgtA n=1 Tax=Actinopolymorpha alba TaxID=533267 RepID=UPI000375EDF0|nr:ergothioneine biosynthesis glutamate--cysteine ligase EgtA [Actinopolymorpha alba]